MEWIEKARAGFIRIPPCFWINFHLSSSAFIRRNCICSPITGSKHACPDLVFTDQSSQGFASFVCILPFYHAKSELTIGLCHLFSHFVHIFSHSVQNFIKNAKAACMTISRTPLRRSYHNYLLFSSRFKKASRFIFARSSVSFRLVFTFFTTFPS